MGSIHELRPSNMSAAEAAGNHETSREGVILGLITATATWVWVALIDAVAGEPFFTASMLGGLVAFTLGHYLLNVLYGVVIVSTIRNSARAPSLIIAAVFGFITMEMGFAMVTILLSNLGLGELAWLRIFGGSVLGAVIAFAILAKRYPLAQRLHEAEEER